MHTTRIVISALALAATWLLPSAGSSAYAQTASGRVTLAPETPLAAQTRAPCTSNQNPAAPLAPAEPYVNGVGDAAIVTSKAGISIQEVVGAPGCVFKTFETWEEFWTNAESQDVILHTYPQARFEDAGFLGNGAATGSASARGALTPVVDSFYIVSLAKSRFNDDRALLIAAAKAVPNPANLVWKRFRIQLTKITTGAHFCTPAADALVFSTILGMSGTRLFVAFDAAENFSVTSGSVLSIDAKSLLRGGPAQLKCFTGPQLIDVAPPDVRDDSRNAYFLAAPIFSNAIRRLRLRTFPNVANDTMTALADINVPAYGLPPAATQPNGFLLDAGSSEFRVASIQAGNFLWNVHTIDGGNGHPTVRLYKFSAGAANPLMTLTLSTLGKPTDDLIAPSLAIEPPALGNEAFVTFTRTIATSPNAGRATLMMARGPAFSSAGWTSSALFRSPGQFSKNSLGGPCDAFFGCQFGPNSSTVLDPENGLVWGFGETITNGTIGGAGSEKNWTIRGVGLPN